MKDRVPISDLQRLDALKAPTKEPSVASKSSPDGAQHSEWHDVTVSMVYLTVHTALAMSVHANCLVVTFVEVLHKVSYFRYVWSLRLCFSNSTSAPRSSVALVQLQLEKCFLIPLLVDKRIPFETILNTIIHVLVNVMHQC